MFSKLKEKLFPEKIIKHIQTFNEARKKGQKNYRYEKKVYQVTSKKTIYANMYNFIVFNTVLSIGLFLNLFNYHIYAFIASPIFGFFFPMGIARLGVLLFENELKK